MSKYEEITAARKLLELPERASMQEIKSNYKRLISRWHPDSCQEDLQECTQMTRKLNAAYNIILDYCANYRYSFSEKEIQNYLSTEEWWMERFGDDPVWGGRGKE